MNADEKKEREVQKELSGFQSRQLKALDEASSAVTACFERAQRCASLELLVLAREYDYFANSLKRAIDWQRNVLEKPDGE